MKRNSTQLVYHINIAFNYHDKFFLSYLIKNSNDILKKQNHYTEEFDRVLIELVGRVGEAKWAEITRQMKQIYGIKVTQKPMVQARWRAIDPKINRESFSPEEMVIHWHMCILHKCHWDGVKAEYESLGQTRDKCYLSQKFYSLFQFKLSDLNKMFGRSYNQNQLRIEEMRDTTKKRILEIEQRDIKQIHDKASVEIVVSCKIIIKLLTYLVDNHKEDWRLLASEIQQYIPCEKFQKVLQNIFTIDTIVLISCNEIKPSDENKEIQELEEKKKAKYIKPHKIRGWDDAAQVSSSPEHTEDEETLRTCFSIPKIYYVNTFTKADIEELKQSQMYKICNTDKNQTFYDWYNEAKIQKATIRTDCLVDVHDLMKENNEKNASKQRKTLQLVKKQMKQIEKKKQLLMQQSNGTNIKTVRGKIKMDKEVFPGCYTKFFNKEDSDKEMKNSFLQGDPDQIYNMAMLSQKYQFNDS